MSNLQNETISNQTSKAYPYYSQAWGDIRERMSHLQGRVLTLIDAAIPDQVQRKAIKDLIKQDFNDVEFLDSWSLREIIIQVTQKISSEYGDPCFPDMQSPVLPATRIM